MPLIGIQAEDERLRPMAGPIFLQGIGKDKKKRDPNLHWPAGIAERITATAKPTHDTLCSSQSLRLS